MTDRELEITRPTTDERRLERIQLAAWEAASLAVLGVSAGDIEERLMARSPVPMTIEELRYAATLVHNATITLPDTTTPENTPS